MDMWYVKNSDPPETDHGELSAVEQLVSFILSIRHKVAHKFGWNTGRVETWYNGGTLMVGFRCDTCGKLGGVHKSYQFRQKDRN